MLRPFEDPNEWTQRRGPKTRVTAHLPQAQVADRSAPMLRTRNCRTLLLYTEHNSSFVVFCNYCTTLPQHCLEKTASLIVYVRSFVSQLVHSRELQLCSLRLIARLSLETAINWFLRARNRPPRTKQFLSSSCFCYSFQFFPIPESPVSIFNMSLRTSVSASIRVISDKVIRLVPLLFRPVFLGFKKPNLDSQHVVKDLSFSLNLCNPL